MIRLAFFAALAAALSACASARVKRDLMDDCLRRGRTKAECKARQFEW